MEFWHTQGPDLICELRFPMIRPLIFFFSNLCCYLKHVGIALCLIFPTHQKGSVRSQKQIQEPWKSKPGPLGQPWCQNQSVFMPSNLDNILLIKINGEIKHALKCTWDHSPHEAETTPVLCTVRLWQDTCPSVRVFAPWSPSMITFIHWYWFCFFLFHSGQLSWDMCFLKNDSSKVR